jgi:hypothetical protein
VREGVIQLLHLPLNPLPSRAGRFWIPCCLCSGEFNLRKYTDGCFYCEPIFWLILIDELVKTQKLPQDAESKKFRS